MIRFQIPKAYLPGFESLLSLQPQQVEQICAFLQQVPVGTGPQTFARLYDEAFKDEPAFNRKLTASLFSLGSFKITHDNISQAEIVEAFVQSLIEQTAKKLSPEEIIKLKAILTDIFQASKSLEMSFKAFQLLAEKENVFRNNHIITDIRLLFKDEISDPERRALITHQLRLEADDAGETIHYYFSLTLSDLQKMQEQITRAIEKEKLIRNDYNKSIDFITVTE